MKRFHAAIFLLLLFFPSISAVTNKTFFMPRPVSQDAVLQHASRTSWINDNEGEADFAIDVTVFYQESTNSSGLARYFFPDNKTELQIKGTQAVGTKDVSGSWLQISGEGNDGMYLNDFESKIKISPKQESFGAILNLHKKFNSGWFSASFPFVQVKTDLRLNEYDEHNFLSKIDDIDIFEVNAGGAIGITRYDRPYLQNNLNAIEAFNNALWKYGKIKNGVQKLAGLADVTLKAGFRPFEEKRFIFDIYADLVIPTGYKPKSEYLFEPMVGNGKHWGIGGGINLDINLWNKKDFEINLITDLNLNYFFENEEKRSFDLTGNGPWSRYFLIIEPDELELPQPGINFFTKKLYVTPKFQLNWLTILHVNFEFLNIEVGYNLWFRQKEKVELKIWDESIYICHTQFNQPLANPTETHSFSQARIDLDINTAGGADPNIIYVSQQDLNIESAVHPKIFSHKIYAALQISGEWKDNPVATSVSGAYEFANSNKSLENWSIWFQVNILV